jgi:hypothetical protein
LTVRGIQVESKEEITKRIGRSPDAGDSAVYALAQRFMPGMGIFEFYAEEYRRLSGTGPTAPVDPGVNQNVVKPVAL